jgi:hypothetical protein
MFSCQQFFIATQEASTRINKLRITHKAIQFDTNSSIDSDGEKICNVIVLFEKVNKL